MIFQRSVLQKRLLNSQFHDGNDFDLQIWNPLEKEGIF